MSVNRPAIRMKCTIYDMLVTHPELLECLEVDCPFRSPMINGGWFCNHNGEIIDLIRASRGG
jgi:hypothetical protein